MKFEKRQIQNTEGTILAHNISDRNGRRILRKGIEITAKEIDTLHEMGIQSTYVAVLERGDINEAEAAPKIAEWICGDYLRRVGAATGRTNILAETHGVLQVDVDRLMKLNQIPGITTSTLRERSVVPERQMVASIKIIPYAVASKSMQAIMDLVEDGPIVMLKPLVPKKVHLVLLGGRAILERLETDFKPPLEARIVSLGSELTAIHKIATNVEDSVSEIASALENIFKQNIDLLIIAGETAIMDRRDVIPSAVEKAGGRVLTIGAPVDPGNLLMIAYIGEIPIMGAPGCARSPKENVVDWILPRLLSGEHLDKSAITSLGHGGLLEDIKERPHPRSSVGSEKNA
jgi:molybdenum cofactor cytidylyltransferase